MLDIISKSRIVAIFLFYLVTQILHMQRIVVLTVHLRTKLHIPNCGHLVSAIRLSANENITLTHCFRRSADKVKVK